jgi:hypothetical protein
MSLGTINETKVVFPEKYQDLLVDVIGTPTFSMVRTFDF